MAFFQRSCVGVVCALATFSQATTLVAVGLPELTRTSDAVVRGTVSRVEARWTKDGARIITDTEIQVAETLKGAVGTKIVVMQPGGEVGDVGQRVEAVASFSVGDEVVVFLESRGTRFTVAGMVQGKLRVERPGDGRVLVVGEAGGSHLVDPATRQPTSRPPVSMTLEALREEVRAAMRAMPPGPPRRPPAGTTLPNTPSDPAPPSGSAP